MATGAALWLYLLCHVLLAVAAAAAAADDRGKSGICHGRVGGNLPPPATAAALLRQNGVTKARLFLPDPAVLQAFAAAGIDLTVGVPNENLTFLAASGPEGAARWLRSAVLAHAPAERLRCLAVGNEVLYGDTFYAPHLVPAMMNLHAALAAMGLEGRVKVSSAHSSSVLAASYPPSAGAFGPAALPVLRPMLRFLADTGAPFMLNTYPFISYVNDPANVPLAYALFGAGAAPVQDGALAYTNLFDATVDALVAALEKEGFGGVPVAVTETGWPTAGHPAATPQNAAAYNAEIVGRAARGVGTPRRPGVPVEVFLFDMYDEDGKPGAEFERHFGIFRADGSKAYDINFA
ncbi:putative glucan endo-1,3-beta-glucosidase BG1 [Dichanthelium oligosanthes]|uniref:Putative glucan endo-1,3-beta-glucosidase BG1 n=1 Tax=Dichanthelium oligosanthes TaxID=888268 RepID=A0A1E5V486_9POAL|nr:putative glucan endo-1,3-beta-glucosidase BG1 [Dichanthelium oligosanthes]